MIEGTRFLGLPLRTPRQRRALVVGYYCLVLGFAALALAAGKGMALVVLPQTITLGGLLGGIKMGGPVKPYRTSALPLDMGATVVSLNLSGRRLFGASLPLDEREEVQRDHAHYSAYRILLWSMATFLMGYLLLADLHASWLFGHSIIMMWLLLLYALSLPQSVLLWTEPADPSAELLEMRERSAASRKA